MFVGRLDEKQPGCITAVIEESRFTVNRFVCKFHFAILLGGRPGPSLLDIPFPHFPFSPIRDKVEGAGLTWLPPGDRKMRDRQMRERKMADRGPKGIGEH